MSATPQVPGSRDAVAFLFGSQGSQRPGMARDLLARDPRFGAEIERCEGRIRARLGWSLSAELAAPDAKYRLHRDHGCIQPALTAVQLAAAEVLRARGIVPSAVGSLSGGEFAAACEAGAIDREEALDVACSVAELARASLRSGGMAFLRLGWEETGRLIDSHRATVSRAVQLGARATVIAGDEPAVRAVLAAAGASGIEGALLPLSQAFHSPAVAAMGESFLASLAHLDPRPARIPIYSAVTGDRLDGRAAGAAHWWRVCSEPSRVLDLARAMIRDGHRRFLELSPHPMLAGTIAEAAEAAGVTVEVIQAIDADRGGAALDRAVAAIAPRAGR